MPAANCSNPNKLVNDWVTKNDFMKYGLGDVTLAKVFNFFGDEASKASKIKLKGMYLVNFLLHPLSAY